MTIRKRLARSNLVMLLIPVVIATALLLAGGGLRVTLTLPLAKEDGNGKDPDHRG